MGKLTVLLIITGIMTFFACNPNAKQKAQIKKEILDSIKKADSLAQVFKIDSLKKVSIIKAKHKLDSINNCFFIDKRDNKKYKNVIIGSQTWMAENLRFKANNGCCAYDNNESNANIFGYLYDWETAKKVCPAGWHLSSNTEWKILITYLGGVNIAAGKLKEADITHWQSPNYGTTNETGFSALPGGCSSNGAFKHIGAYGYWWSSSEYNTSNAWGVSMGYDDSKILKLPNSETSYFSVRCVKD